MRVFSTSLFPIAAAAVAGAMLVSPAVAASEKGGREVVINFGEDGDLLEQLIEMDAEAIAGMRAEFTEARAEIRDAISEIAEARADVDGVPGGRVVLKIAFATARSAASMAINEALAEARAEVVRAKSELTTLDVSSAERTETAGALSILGEELDALEATLEELIEALQA
ncbi:MAG: hypothetical protein ACKVS5_04295 [Parvularculaceae bacterium]